jgi:hypothetical protein
LVPKPLRFRSEHFDRAFFHWAIRGALEALARGPTWATSAGSKAVRQKEYPLARRNSRQILRHSPPPARGLFVP